MTTLTVLPAWQPWRKTGQFTATHGRRSHGPHSISVWHKTNRVNLALHNRQKTWSTWLDLTPDEALHLAQSLISAARSAQTSE